MNRRERRKRKQIEYKRMKNNDIEFRNKCRELKNICEYFQKMGCLSIESTFVGKRGIGVHIHRKMNIDMNGFTKTYHSFEFDKYSKDIEGVKIFYLKEKPTEVD